MNTFVLSLVMQALLCVLVVIWVRVRLRRFLDSDETVDRARKDVASLLVELDGTTDRNVTILEAKLSELKDMVADADRRIALLARDKPKGSAPPVSYDRHGKATHQPGAVRPLAQETPSQAGGISDGLGEQAAISEPGDQRRRGTSDYAYSATPPPATSARHTPGEEDVDRDSPPVPFIRFSSKPIPVEEPFPDRVMYLFRKGMSVDMIATNLGANASEVEIVIAMEEGRNRRPEGA
ncbi:MAG: hypothetical protein E4H20_02120 [Spirochaetales bacterium]|nr:MAG: hypothetical protein E4H20_02120 [Spirochaetales bacterium]